ncbi:MAG: oligosaccharide flippase family protein [bacterium]|nr:oligosaccharide flippase family protein [bacterium]
MKNTQNNIHLMIKDSIKYVISKIIPGLSGFLVVILFIRIIGAEQYGRYALAFSFVTMASAFFSGWINQSLLRFYNKYVRIPVAKKSIIIALFLSTAVGIATLLLVNTLGFSPQSRYSWLPFMLILALFGVFNFYQLRIASFRAQIKPDHVVLLTGLQAILQIILSVIFFFTIDKTCPVALFGLLLSYGLPLFLWFPWFSGGHIGINQPKNHRIGTKFIISHLWQYGWPLSFWYASMSMLQVTDRYLIQRYYSFDETGIYAGVFDLVTRGYSLLLFPITLASHPRIMNYWNLKKRKEALSILKWAMAAQFTIFVLLVSIFLIFSSYLANLIDAMLNVKKSVSSLIIPLLVGGFLWQFALLAHKPFELSRKTQWMLIAVVAALVTNFTGNYYFLPGYGIIAAAYTTIISAVVYLCCLLLLSRWTGINLNKQ